jgi:hypothetical protein
MWNTLDEEKCEIKQSLGTQFVENQLWQPIATIWFEKWKIYVNFDEVEPEPRDMVSRIYS